MNDARGTPPTSELHIDCQHELDVMHARLRKALQQRDDARDKTKEYVAALRAAIFEAYRDQRLLAPRRRKLVVPGVQPSEEVAVLMASDWQLGKKTPTYNSEVCAARIRRMAERTIAIARNHPARVCHLYLLGDIVEGEGIFPTQAHVVDASLYRQIMHGAEILTQLILDLLEHFEQVHVVGVIGNHGQVRLRNGESDPETNMDRLLYSIVKFAMRGRSFADRVTWNIPEGKGERNWFAVDHIYDWGFLLCHGDQIRGGFAGFPFYGTAKKAWGWIDSIDEPWDYLLFGHWHTPTMQTLNRREVRCNGSTESSNTYAQEQLAAMGAPTQWLGFVHPQVGVAAEYWLRLEDRTPNMRRHR